jgi:prolipoprotein diacylglyceryltransferase
VPTLPFNPVIELSFDPIAELGDWHVRLQTIGLAVAILVALLVAAWIAGRTSIDARLAPDAVDLAGTENHLRRDDLLYIAVAAMPGAVVGGRIGWAIVNLGYVTATPGSLLDFGTGGFELSLAVVGGTITGVAVARLLDTPVAGWLHSLIVPVLLAIAGGKLAMVLGGDGQGTPFDGAWATAYLGAGPWLSLAPAIPSHPSQVYEALATIAVVVGLAVLLGAGAFHGRRGGAFFAGLALWCGVRVLVGFTWRDPVVLGPFSADQLLGLAIGVGALAILAGLSVGRRERQPVPVVAAAGAGTTGAADPDWPDPGSRPRI